MAIEPLGGSQYDAAYSLLAALSPVEAARILGVEVDLLVWLNNNRLELDVYELTELKALFRA